MAKLKVLLRTIIITVVLCVMPVPIPVAGSNPQVITCEAATYDDFKSGLRKITDGAKQFWDDSASDRAKLIKKAKQKWKKLQKKIKKEYPKYKKKGKKGLKQFQKWRKKQEKEFWQWFNDQMQK